jgi:hypothetical protein
MNMASILVPDLSPELEASIRQYAETRGLTMPQAALELMQIGMEANGAPPMSGGVGAAEYVAETLKEVLHTKDEADEFIRNRE